MGNIKYLRLFAIVITTCTVLGYFVVLHQQDQLLNPVWSLSKSKSSELSKIDYRRLIDIQDFEFSIKHRGCHEMENKPKVVILVHSTPSNFARRATIRDTWGYKDPRSLLLFILGAVNITDVKQKLATESMVHDDILQGSFVDSYHNMTYKHAAVLKWFVYNCPDASFLLKADDDVFINTPLLYTYLEQPRIFSHFLHQGKLLFCNANTGMQIMRKEKSKWYVSPDEYPGRVFPTYCSGFTILYSADVVLELYKAVQTLPYFFIDDVHITGTANLNAKIPYAKSNGLILNREQRDRVLAGKVHIENLPFFFGFYNLNEQNIRKLWSFVICSSEGWGKSPFCQMMKWMVGNVNG